MGRPVRMRAVSNHMAGIQLKNPNLLSQISKPATKKRPPGFYSSIVLDALGILSAIGIGYVYEQYLAGSVPLWELVLGVGIFLIVSMLGMLLAQNERRRMAVIAAESVSAVFFFVYIIPLSNLALAAVVLLLFLIWGDIAGRRELTAGLEIRFFHVVRPQLRKLVSGLILSGIIIFIPQWTPDSAFLPRPIFDRVFNGTTNISTRWHPDLRVNSTVKAFAESIATSQLNKDPNYASLQDKEKTAIFNKFVDDILAKMSNGLDLAVNADEPLNELLYRFVTTVLGNWQHQFGTDFVLGWAVVAYLVFRSIAVVLYIVSSIIGFLIFQILIAANFIVITGETRLRETIQYQ